MPTIAAIATPPGRGAVGIVRLSGPDSLRIVKTLFTPANSSFSHFVPYRLHHGQLHDKNGLFLDDALVVFMPGPASFTGEDVAELQCHGSAVVLHHVLAECLSLGARGARPGEFSRRAFVNGRMDLTQAESIMELVNAPSETAASLAGAKMSGLLARRISELKERLEALRVQFCIAVDFPDEELECLPLEALSRDITAVRADIADLAANFERTRCLREGVLAVLVGRVNAGKSSLLNAILGTERALVTDVPGTTRDYLEESVTLHGVSFRLVDTAGLRAAADPVEQLGMQRGRDLARGADLTVLVLDASQEPGPEDLSLAESDRAVLVAANKMDLLSVLPDWFGRKPWSDLPLCPVCAKNGEGIDALLERMYALATRGTPGGDILAPNARQCAILRRAAEELDGLLRDAAASMSVDILSVRLDLVCSLLGEITGEISSEDVLNAVFSGFCIGK